MLKHWIWLTTRRGIGTRSCISLLRLFGTAESIYALTEYDCLRTEGFDRRWLEGVLDKSMEHVMHILEDCEKHGISILTYADEEYPERLRNIPDPPIVLYYKGNLPDFDHEAAIGVVGSRRCSAYGLLHAKQFSKLISASGGIVVSGGARGIDTMALHGALDSNMPVVCVMGCGLDVIYPRENKYLFKEIEAHGCMISEYPPGTPPDGSNFPVRNRLISGLSLGVLVIEAPERSGALITATHALEQGRDVFAIPGNIGVKQCEGSNRLIREGAMMVNNGWEILEGYRFLFPDKLSDGRLKESMHRIYQKRFQMALPVYSPVLISDNGDKKVVDNHAAKLYSDEKEQAKLVLSQDEELLYSKLTAEPIHGDTLVALCELPASRVMAAMTLLQIKGVAQKLPGNYYQRK